MMPPDAFGRNVLSQQGHPISLNECKGPKPLSWGQLEVTISENVNGSCAGTGKNSFQLAMGHGKQEQFLCGTCSAQFQVVTWWSPFKVDFRQILLFGCIPQGTSSWKREVFMSLYKALVRIYPTPCAVFTLRSISSNSRRGEWLVAGGK